MAAFRRSHAVFRRRTYFDGRINPLTGLRDVSWLDDDGHLLSHDEWHSDSRNCFGALLDADPAEADSKPMLLLFNNGTESLPFVLPGTADTRWTLSFDTALTPSFPAPTRKPRSYAGAQRYLLLERSVCCLSLTFGTCEVVESPPKPAEPAVVATKPVSGVVGVAKV